MGQGEIAAPESVGGRKRAVLLPLFGLFLSLAYCVAALQYPVGTPTVPAAGSFPLFAGLLLIGSSGVAVLAEWRHPTAIPDASGPFVWRVPALAVALPILPLVFVIGTLMEQSFLQTLVLARGDPGYLLTRPIALILLVAGTLILVLPAMARGMHPRPRPESAR